MTILHIEHPIRDFDTWKKAFDSSSAAKDFLAAMREVWQSPSAGPALAGTPQTRIIEVVESKEY